MITDNTSFLYVLAKLLLLQDLFQTSPISAGSLCVIYWFVEEI